MAERCLKNLKVVNVVNFGIGIPFDFGNWDSTWVS